MSPCSRMLSGNRVCTAPSFTTSSQYRPSSASSWDFQLQTRDFSRACSRTSASDRAILGATMQRERPVSVSCTSLRPCVCLDSFVTGPSTELLPLRLSFALGLFVCPTSSPIGLLRRREPFQIRAVALSVLHLSTARVPCRFCAHAPWPVP